MRLSLRWSITIINIILLFNEYQKNNFELFVEDITEGYAY